MKLLSKGFTLIELVVVIAIIAVLSGVILFSVTQYINKGKDSNISGNLAVLIPAGEVYYNAENSLNNDGYTGFCDSSVVTNAISQMPPNASGACTSVDNASGVCCNVDTGGQAWAACATEFGDSNYAYCVDSRGLKKEICSSQCLSEITVCPTILDSCSGS